MRASTVDPVSRYAEALAGDLESELARDEWHLCRLGEGIVSGLSASEAFEAVGRVASRLCQSDPDLRWEWSSFLLSLARQSNTTEMPRALREHWPSVVECAGVDSSLASQLQEWSRTPTI